MKHLQKILQKYRIGTATEAEKIFVEKYYDYFESGEDFSTLLSEQERIQLAEENWERLQQRIDAPESVPMFTARKKWMAAAAAVVLLLSAGSYLWLKQSASHPAPAQPLAVTTDIAPGASGAILTLADGTKLILDSLRDGRIASQNGSDLIMKQGQINYHPAGKSASDITYNTMTTPRGRQFQLVLPDGSKVWLNAASSITYPTAFTGKERTVQVNGEAYFDIAKNSRMPFRVKVNNAAEVEVLGTTFNVNAYSNEQNIRTTLIGGAVKVTANGQEQLLKPGQQALLSSSHKLQLIDDADLDKVTAWKNGIFDFDGVPFEEVMRQLERWYDIDVKYAGAIPKLHFKGRLPRDFTLVQLVETLREVEVKFTIEGRTLIVQ